MALQDGFTTAKNKVRVALGYDEATSDAQKKGLDGTASKICKAIQEWIEEDAVADPGGGNFPVE